ncbi:SusC/RagA family TonB-linked outer membrane protein [Niastella populi]|uniref:SusC/RagA family TonB-linked outer membrane protein n=1 Tax=Niastella populi TaxID=550983 RepID=A0A1V9FET3_9BACT|nr:TonB-dependent receptor [Niastella populi]OQP56777.1 SusC/RagA family TonB-linked outer membrane protein [Niastella populi]
MRLLTILQKKVLLWSIPCMFLGISPGRAQEKDGLKKITGKVFASADSRPIQDATIFITGTGTNTSSDHNGSFTIEAKEGDVLIISMIGYLQKEIKVGKNIKVEVKLEQNSIKLDDVVVIGYGKSKRKDITGAISSVSGDDIRKVQPVTIDQALQGKVPGAVVQQISGQPGGAVSIQIRGLSSFGNNPPLYVIDGVIIGGTGIGGSGSNPLAGINPSEVESIDVLKDASATAIYGSQATNGVIIITTKRGQAGAPKITYDMYAGKQQLPKEYATMNLREYAQFMNEKSAVIGYDLRPQFTNPQYLGEGTNWQKVLFRNAPMQNHSITVAGGDNRTQYLLSGSYFQQEGIALGSNFTRASVRLNLDNKTTSWLKTGISLQLVRIGEKVNTTNSNVISTALMQTPDVNVQNADGSWGGNDPNIYGAYATNPYAIALIIKDQKKRNQIFGNAYAEIAFTRDLTLRNEVSGSFDFGTQDHFTPTYTMGNVTNKVNSSTYNYGQNYYTTLRNYLTYNRLFANKYNVNALLGHEAQLSTFENVSATRRNFPSNNVQAINSGDATTATNTGDKGQNAQESYFGRLNFAYNDRYLLTGNIRFDGSSKFAPGNRWVATWSGALAWKINNEDFFKQVTAVNELKLRVGYGLTNNQNIADNSYVASLNTISTGLSGISQLAGNLPNPLVQWEKTKYANVGLDGAFFNWRISFSVDYYDRKTDGLLLSLPLPLYSGTIPSTSWSPGSLAAPYKNIAAVSNKGFDLRISSVNVRNKNFSWKTDVTVSHNTNKILALNSEGAALYGYYGTTIAAKSVVGRSIGEFWGYQTDGLFTGAEDFKTHPAIPVNPTTGVKIPITPTTGGVWLGDVKFRDLNGDTLIDQRDQTYLGSPIPKFQIGFNNTFSYKNFDLNVFFSANIGNKVLNTLRITGDNPNQNFGYFKSVLDYARLELIDKNGSATDVNNVYVSNPSTNIVRISQSSGNDNERISDRYIEDGTFLRCKNISLGYTLPEKLLSKVHMHSLRVYFNVTNAFIISRYRGMDPEIGSWNPLLAGVDNGFYPQPRVFTIGANLALTK